MDKIAGLYTQVQQLKKRLKELNTADADPTEISAVADALEKLETRLEKQNEQKKQRQIERQKAQEEKEKQEKEFLSGVSEDLKPKEDTPAEVSETQTDTPTEVTNTPSTPEPVSVEAPSESTTTEMPMAASTEKESDVNVFALDSIVEPVKGTPGSYGRVMRHDGPDNDVFVIWEGGKLKDEHVAGGYSPKDLRVKEAYSKDQEEKDREEREERFKKKKKEMGISGRKLSKRDKSANLTSINDEDVKVGTKFVFARSVMAKDGIIIPAGTEAELDSINGDHFYLRTSNDVFVINRFDTPKLIIASSTKQADFKMKKERGLSTNWYEGTTPQGYRYQAKVYEGGSQYGINEGPVSKLWVQDPKTKEVVVSFDRGWDVGEELTDVWMPVVEELEAGTQAGVESSTMKPKHVEQTNPEMGDVNEDPGSGYGGDRPGQWVQPKASGNWKNNPDFINDMYDRFGEETAEKKMQNDQVMQKLYKTWVRDFGPKTEANLKVANKEWFATKKDTGYLISDEAGTDICLIKAKADLSKEQLEEIVYNELLKREMLTFSLKKPVALLKAGHKISILEVSKNKFKFASKENKTSGWAPLDSLKVEVKEIQSSTQKKGKIVHKKDGWYVQSEQGKNLGGPYKSREKAQDRLTEVEMFKHMKATKIAKNSPYTLKRSIINKMIKECPSCYDKFRAIAKKNNHRFLIAEDVQVSPEEQIQRVKERLQTIKDRFETQSKQASKKKAEHPIEEPAVADVVRSLEMDIDKLENMYRDNPEAIQNLEEIEDKINQLEVQIGVDLPEMTHEREEGHEKDIEKETYNKPKPLDQPPQGFKWAYDPDTQDWALVVTDAY